jgi:hypothetical protein
MLTQAPFAGLSQESVTCLSPGTAFKLVGGPGGKSPQPAPTLITGCALPWMHTAKSGKNREASADPLIIIVKNIFDVDSKIFSSVICHAVAGTRRRVQDLYVKILHVGVLLCLQDKFCMHVCRYDSRLL